MEIIWTIVSLYFFMGVLTASWLYHMFIFSKHAKGNGVNRLLDIQRITHGKNMVNFFFLPGAFLVSVLIWPYFFAAPKELK